MKINHYQLEAHLARTCLPVYIISGEEYLLREEAAGAVRNAIKKNQDHERIRLTPDANFNWNNLYDFLFSSSLFSQKQLIEIDLRQTASSKVPVKLFEDYAAKRPQDQILLIEIGKNNDALTKTTWFKSLEKIGGHIATWPLSRDQLSKWIVHRSKRHHLNISEQALHTLTELVEGNLLAAHQAIEKLYLFQAKKTIDVKMIQTILNDNSHLSIFDFVEKLMASHANHALRILAQLKSEGTDPVLILWAITRELRLLGDLSESFSKGEPMDKLFKKHRIFAQRQNGIKKFLLQFSKSDCLQLLLHAARIDQSIKGGHAEDPWHMLQLFCLRLL